MQDFDAPRQREAKVFHRRARALGLTSTALTLLGLTLALATGFSAWLQAVAVGISPNPWAVVTLYFVMGFALVQALGLPLGIVGHHLESAYGISRQGRRSWGVDVLKGMLISFAFGLAAVEALYWALRNLGPWWWPALWALGLGVSALVGFVAPVLLMPIFHRYDPLEAGEVRQRLEDLAARAGLGPVGIYRMAASAKTSRGMAALAGLGRTRRVILSDTLLQSFTPAETSTVFAHELGHHVHGDALRGFIAGAVDGFAILGIIGLALPSVAPTLGMRTSDVATLPLVLLTADLLGLALGPLGNYLSRRKEAAADQYALDLTNDPEAFASAMVKIHDQNLSDASPHPLVEALFYSHPSGRRRLAMAKAWGHPRP